MSKVLKSDLVQVTQIFVFQINGTRISPSDPIVSTPWNTQDAAFSAAKVYSDQLNAWWSHKYPGDIYTDYDSIYWDIVHLDSNGDTIRFGVLPDPNDHPPLPVGLTGYYIGPWTDGTDWIPLPM